MGQLIFNNNLNYIGPQSNLTYLNGSLSFVPYTIFDSISLGTFNILYRSKVATGGTHTLSLGLYSLTGSTLTLANSGSLPISVTGIHWESITTWSSTQNISPGTWFWGFLFSTNVSSLADLFGVKTIGAANAFPGGFIGGAMSESTNALPSSFATSNIDSIGLPELMIPVIILNS